MSSIKIITPGDDLAIVSDLYESGALANLSAATISACIQDGSGRRIIAPTAQSSATTGAAWATGRVVCAFSAALSVSLRVGSAWLEINVTRAGKRTTWPLIALDVQASAA